MKRRARQPAYGHWPRRWRHSLGARLIALFLLFALAMTVVFIAGTRSALRSGWQDYAKPLVGNYAELLAAEIGTPPDVARAQALADRLPLRIRIQGPVVNWSSEGDDQVARGDPRDPRRWRDHNPRLWTQTLADGHRISFGLADLPDDDRPHRLGWLTLALLLGLTALAYHFVRRLLNPLKGIRAGVQRYGEGDFSQPIGARRQDELGTLALQIDGMAERLHGMLEAKRSLLLAISHELRSPLTRARLNAELVDEAAPTREALLKDLAEMRDLVSDLLESERLAAGHAALQTEEVDLNALIGELVDAQFPGGRVLTTLDAELPKPLRLDPMRLRLMLRNLIDNALRHGRDAADTPVRVSTRLDGDAVLLTVRDHGPGVEPEHLRQLGEAFYRPDAARSRSAGGVGLGLHLSRQVAQSHGGQLTLRPSEPGLIVEVRLPRAAASLTPAR